MYDISAFLAIGARFSVDVKLHGPSGIIDQVQYESQSKLTGPLCAADINLRVIPRVAEVFLKSQNSDIRDVGEALRDSLVGMEHSSDGFLNLSEAILTINMIERERPCNNGATLRFKI